MSARLGDMREFGLDQLPNNNEQFTYILFGAVAYLCANDLLLPTAY